MGRRVLDWAAVLVWATLVLACLLCWALVLALVVLVL